MAMQDDAQIEAMPVIARIDDFDTRSGSLLERLIFNNRLDAGVTILLVVMVSLVVVESARVWIGVLTGRREARVKEAPFVATRLVMEEQG